MTVTTPNLTSKHTVWLLIDTLRLTLTRASLPFIAPMGSPFCSNPRDGLPLLFLRLACFGLVLRNRVSPHVNNVADSHFRDFWRIPHLRAHGVPLDKLIRLGEVCHNSSSAERNPARASLNQGLLDPCAGFLQALVSHRLVLLRSRSQDASIRSMDDTCPNKQHVMSVQLFIHCDGRLPNKPDVRALRN